MSQFEKILRHTTEKGALKLVKLSNLRAIRLKRAKIQPVTKVVWWGASLYPPPYKRPQNFVTLRSYNYFRVFFFNKLLPNLEIFIFTNFESLFSSGVDGFSLTCPCQKLKKTVEGSISFTLPIIPSGRKDYQRVLANEL